MLAPMNLAANSLRWLCTMALSLVASSSVTELAAAQNLPRVSATRALRVGGLSIDPHAEDLLGLGRIKFHGVIAAELSSVGYTLGEPGDASAARNGAVRGQAPLELFGYVRE